MTPEEILQGLYDETLVGNGPRVLELTHEALGMKMEPQNLLFDALIPALEEVGARFERGDFFVPEMLIAGRAMAGSMEVLRPLLADTGVVLVEVHDPDGDDTRAQTRMGEALAARGLVCRPRGTLIEIEPLAVEPTRPDRPAAARAERPATAR